MLSRCRRPIGTSKRPKSEPDRRWFDDVHAKREHARLLDLPACAHVEAVLAAEQRYSEKRE